MSSEGNYDEQKAANLARIRDNQRRSRARRKEYLQELEERYRVCEQLGVEASAEMQTAARRVIEENRRLRALLRQHGYTDATIDRAVFDGSISGISPVAGLEALFGQRKMPQFAQSASETMPYMSSTGASGPASSSSSLAAGPSSSSSTMYHPSGAYTDSNLDDVRLAGQQGMQYGTSPQWGSVYQRDYVGQPTQASEQSSMARPQHHFDVPSLQTIKTEVGYGPQEEIDDTDQEYSMHDEQTYDIRKGYQR